MNAEHWKDCQFTIAKPVNGHAKGTTKLSKKSAARWLAFARLVEEIGPTVKPSEFQLLAVLFKRADAKSRRVRISQKTIGELMHLQRRQVYNLIESLEAKKLIEVVSKGNEKTHDATIYRYLW